MYLREDAKRIKEALPNGTEVPEDADDLFLLYAVLLRAKGPAVTAADVHDAWVAWTAGREPHHSALVPYEDLPIETRAEDEPFADAIRRAAFR